MNANDYRSWGKTRNCHGCRYWSEMIAKVEGGVLSAMCICGDSPNNGRYTTRATHCSAWDEGSLGAVDQPGGDPYQQEEATA